MRSGDGKYTLARWVIGTEQLAALVDLSARVEANSVPELWKEVLAHRQAIKCPHEMPITEELLAELQAWLAATDFPAPTDWGFASLAQLGHRPWSCDQIWRVYLKTAKAAGIGLLGTHILRHTYRSWLDAVGTGLVVQQKLMRHADIRTTMNVYGDIVTDEMAQAHKKVVGFGDEWIAEWIAAVVNC